MSRQYKNFQANKTFAQLNESFDANEYIMNKRSKYRVCSRGICEKNKNLTTQNNYLSNIKDNNLLLNSCKNSIDKTQLYINLITKLDLSSNISGDTIPVISDLSGNIYPAIIDNDNIPFLTYNIDPSGYLFGNSPCGINNFENYIVYNNIKKYLVYN